MTKKSTLTQKQKLFVANYLSNGFNATKAARDAGYSGRTANVMGAENLTKPSIAEAIKEACEQVLGSVEHLKVKWLQHMSALSFSDYRKVAKFNAAGVEFTDSELLEDEVAFAIESIESTVTYDKSGDKIVTRKVKLHSKKGALDTMGKFLGLLKEEQSQGVTIIINKDETSVL